jgi:hypothetical protein
VKVVEVFVLEKEKNIPPLVRETSPIIPLHRRDNLLSARTMPSERRIGKFVEIPFPTALFRRFRQE